MSISAKDIRNVAIIGHSGEGKTTLCEAMLFNGHSLSRMGKIENGTTVSDYDEQEIARKMSISLTVCHTYWRETKINILDVPGFLDFEGELNEAMRACGAALIVMGPGGNVTVGTEKAISLCMKSEKPMVIFINGMDKDNADYHGTVEALRQAYPAKIAPIQLPIMHDGKMVGIINTLTERAFKFSQTGTEEIPIPADMMDEFENMKLALTETAAENDDVLLEKYFETGTLTRDECIHGIRKGIANMNVIPVMAGSALNNRGVINLMSEIVKYVPQAAERRDLLATDVATGKIINVECEEDGPVAAQIFKTTVDPFVGKLNYLRVNRGVLKAGSTLFNPNTGTTERIASLYVTNGKKQEAVSELTAGDIGAVAKLTNTGTGDTLCDENARVQFDEIPFPRPTLFMAVYAKTQGTEDKVFAGLNKLSEEDKSFTVTKASETGESLIGGQGEVHLDVICKKLKSKFGAEAVLKTPKIAYRETILSTSTAEGKYKKQTGGHGQYGHCKIRFEPSDQPFEFAEEVVGGAVPKQYIPAVEKGIIECLSNGVLAGYPVMNIKAVLYDGSYHDVDSSEAAFKAAAELAFKEGLKNANPTILEPICKMRIAVPEKYLGDVLGDLTKRRGRIIVMDAKDDMQIITADAPQAEIQTYATALRSMTQGRGKFTATFDRYEQAPENIIQQLVK